MMDTQPDLGPDLGPDLAQNLAAIRAELAAIRAEVAALRGDTSATSEIVDGVSVVLTLLAGHVQRLADGQGNR